MAAVLWFMQIMHSPRPVGAEGSRLSFPHGCAAGRRPTHPSLIRGLPPWSGGASRYPQPVALLARLGVGCRGCWCTPNQSRPGASLSTCCCCARTSAAHWGV